VSIRQFAKTLTSTTAFMWCTARPSCLSRGTSMQHTEDSTLCFASLYLSGSRRTPRDSLWDTSSCRTRHCNLNKKFRQCLLSSTLTLYARGHTGTIKGLGRHVRCPCVHPLASVAVRIVSWAFHRWACMRLQWLMQIGLHTPQHREMMNIVNTS